MDLSFRILKNSCSEGLVFQKITLKDAIIVLKEVSVTRNLIIFERASEKV